jgi:lipoprotein-anchoring transpeptidase ErfK/SrfK
MEEQNNNISDSSASPKGFCRAAGEYLNTHRGVRATVISAAVLLLLIFLVAVPVYIAPALQHSWGKSRAECRADSSLLSDKAIRKQVAAINTEVTRLERKLASFIPTQTYIVINTTDNRFFLYRNRNLIREGFVSSGSYTLLKTEDGEKEWIFRTPRGRFTIQGKTTHPVWRKPDWAFVEEGLPIPGPAHPSRYEYGVLGDYALSLGDGYLIHGTLYQRLLGMPVTHGCIRLNDDDLEAVFNALSIGSKVYIY